MYEREMGKRRWLESLECGRAGDKAHRRALSNGHTLREACGVTCEPVKGSRLWRSWTPEDEEHAQHEADHPTHPAMMDLYAIEEVSSSCPDSESEISSDEGLASPRPMIHLSSSIEDVVSDKVIIVRPPPMHRDAEDAESEDDTPSLLTSRSDDSLTETEGWEAQIPTQEKEHPMLPPPVITMKWKSATLPPRQKPKSVEVGWADESYHSLEVVYA